MSWKPSGGGEGSGQTAGGNGATRSGAGKEPEAQQGRFEVSFPVVLRSVQINPPFLVHIVTGLTVVSISEEEEERLMEWFALNHERHVLVRRDMELSYV